MKQSEVAEKYQMALNSEQKYGKYEFMQDNEIIYEHFLGRENIYVYSSSKNVEFVFKVKN